MIYAEGRDYEGMTLKEIAAEAGVSVSTVSRFINMKGPHVARPEIQNRIWEIVSRSGYTPNVHAVGLKRQSEPETESTEAALGSIACLFARTPQSIDDPFFSQLARNVEVAAFKNGYHVQCSLTEVDIKRPSMLQNLMNQQIRGVVVLGRCDKEMLHYLKQRFRYVSYAGLNPVDAKYDQTICDGRLISKKAVEYLIALGHQKIAYIGETNNEQRYLGYCDALREHGMPICDEYIADVQLSTENGYRGAQALMTRDTGVTAIMCANDLTAIGAVRTLHENGVRIPQDISIIGIDDIDMVQYLPTKLTSVHIPVDEMGQMATKLLIDRIDGGHDLPLQVSLPFYIAERESCAKPPKTPWRPR